MDRFDDVKTEVIAGTRKYAKRYQLRGMYLYVSDEGYHFVDYLDAVSEINPEIDGSELTDDLRDNIEKGLQSNLEKFRHQANLVLDHISGNTVEMHHVLDIGCGGGLFLSLMKKAGCDVMGLELNDTRAFYTTNQHGINVVKLPIESPYWTEKYEGYFDTITFWDVIEHVNYPVETLKSAIRMLKEGGTIFLDTPCRDSFYHRFGEFTYAISKGAFPTFLNTMYSSSPFGHKQIFSTQEMFYILSDLGLQVTRLEKFHELSFPYETYLQNITRSRFLAKALLPLVELFFMVFRIQNKMLVIAKKN